MKYEGTAWKSGGQMAKWLDGFAVCASFTCMLHCLALPILIAMLPAVADRIDPGERFHLIVLLLAVPTSAFALLSGYRRHRTVVPVLVGGIGLALMGLGIAFASREAMETALTVIGSLMLAGAHISNWQNRNVKPAAPMA